MDARTQIETFVRSVNARNRYETMACLIVLPIFACIAVLFRVTALRISPKPYA